MFDFETLLLVITLKTVIWGFFSTIVNMPKLQQGATNQV